MKHQRSEKRSMIARDDQLKNMTRKLISAKNFALREKSRANSVTAELHLWQTKADLLQRQLDQVHSSTSWQITRPIRYLITFIRAGITKKGKEFSIDCLRSLARFVQTRPTLMRITNGLLEQYPSLRGKILRHARPPSRHPSSEERNGLHADRFVQPYELDPRANQILHDLLLVTHKENKG